MSKQTYLTEELKKAGMDEICFIPSGELVFSDYVFSQCKRNTCKKYNTNYACPPLSGTPEQNKERVLKHKNACLASKIMSIATSSDFKATQKAIVDLVLRLRETLEAKGYTVLGEGPCSVCAECAALIGEPCRFPDKIRYSMEGSGIDVVTTSINLKMTYNAGGGKIGYFVLVLYND